MHLMKKEINEQPQTLKVTYETNNEKIKAFSKEMKQNNIKSIFIAARGTSDHAAIYGKYMLEILAKIPTGLSASSVNTVYDSALDFEDTLVIGISQSGMGEDVLEVIKKANMDGAMTLSITNNEESKIAKESKVHIHLNVGEEKSVAATKTFTAQMLVMQMLARSLANQDTDLDSIINAINDAISKEEIIKEQALLLVDKKEVFVLGRGINYPICLEAALKMGETSYIRGKGFATSDFRHGPFALLDSEIPVILLSPKDRTEGEMIILSKELKEKGIETYVLTNSSELKKNSTRFIELYTLEDELNYPFAEIVIMQLFSYFLSVEKGLDPDHPRDLKKVTITR